MEKWNIKAPIVMDGTSNFRDLGGYPANGGTTRKGCFYRSRMICRGWKKIRSHVFWILEVEVRWNNHRTESQKILHIIPYQCQTELMMKKVCYLYQKDF